jgi:importin subunit beta-1
VVQAIIQRLEGEIKPQADKIMHLLLRILSSVGPKSSVPDTIFATVGALANALEEDFAKYMDAFTPFLFNALGNQDEPALCAMAIGLVSDIVRSLGEGSQKYCDNFMNYLLNNLRVGSVFYISLYNSNMVQSTALSNQFKPAILQCFGDIAQAIGPHFETYLSVVATVLQQAANVAPGPENAYDMYDYVTSLREGIMDAWSGIIIAMKQGKSKQYASCSKRK